MHTSGQDGPMVAASAASDLITDDPGTRRPDVGRAGPGAPGIAPAPEGVRHAAIDLARGVAIFLMTLDHAGALTRVSLVAERYVERPPDLATGVLWIAGLVTNFASPLFWVLSGASVAILTAASRRRTGSERAATAFLFTRGGVLLLLDALVIGYLWAPVLYLKSTYTFDLLSSLALSLILLSALRRLPRFAFAAATLGVLVGFHALAAAVPASWRDAGGFWVWIWFDYVGGDHPVVSFPVLGWCGLMGLGYLAGSRLGEHAWRRPGRWIAISAGLLAAWLAVRLAGGFGHETAWRPTDGIPALLTMYKGPPSLAYLLFNLSGAALVYAASLALESRAARAPWSWIGALGRASLFAYVAHMVLYKVFAWGGYHVARHSEGWRLLATWLPGLVVLVPAAIWYRRLKERHRESVLKYL